jgi:hypothetical protein
MASRRYTIPGAGQQHVAAGLAGEPAQRRGDQGGAMTAPQVPGVQVPGVAGLPGDRPGRVSEPAVVTGHRHDPRAAAPADRALPGTTQRLRRLADEDLDGVPAFAGLGPIPPATAAPQLHRIKAVNRTGHGDSRSGGPAGNVPPGPGFT